MALPKGEGPRPPTIYDVAKRAGVSHQTVSRQLRGLSGISRETQEKVDQAVRELGYLPNSTARALATSRSKRLAAMIFDLTESGPLGLVKGAAHAARQAGYLLDIISLDSSDRTSIKEAFAIVNQQDFAGLFSVGATTLLRKEIESCPIAIPVNLEMEEVDSPTGTPISLNGRGGELAMNELLANGHTRIGHLGGPVGWMASTNRELAYRRALRRRGLRPLPVVRGDWSGRSGYAAGNAWPLENLPTAVFAANDQMALGLICALRQRGLQVPDQLSVIGFDDIPEAEFMYPPLTTARLDFFDLGIRRIQALIAEIQGNPLPGGAPEGIIELIRRESVRPI